VLWKLKGNVLAKKEKTSNTIKSNVTIGKNPTWKEGIKCLLRINEVEVVDILEIMNLFVRES